VTGQQWLDFCCMIEHPAWMEDPSLGLHSVRSTRRRELLSEIDAWTEQRSVAEIVELATLFRIPSSAVNDASTVVADVGAQSFVWNDAENFLQPRPAFTLRGSAVQLDPGPSPALGADTLSVKQQQRSSARMVEQQPAIASEAPREPPPLPFEGLRVLDFTAFWAGPVIGSFFAMLGAEVIHVESTVRPDGARMNTCKDLSDGHWWEWSPIFECWNTNKKSLTLDLSSEDGRSLARQFVAYSDIVIENFSPRVMENWGLDYESLAQINEDIIMVRAPAFGLSGDLRDRVGYAQTLEHVSGLAFLTGEPSGPPTTLNGVCDPLGGTHAAIATTLALEHRRRTGEGMLVEAPMLGAALNAAAAQIVQFSATGNVLQRAGSASPHHAPQGTYLTADIGADGRQDRWVVISVETDEQWAALARALGEPRWATEDDLGTLAGRRAAEHVLDAELAQWCRQRASEDIIDTLWSAGVPVGLVTLPHEQTDLPQLKARGFFETVEHPLAGSVRHPRYPARFAHGPVVDNRAAAPLLGHDNAELLETILGLDASQIATLETKNVIGSAPTGATTY
jgi:crotonobetainyl-CoA:carnitine CoA-transferase CaiB-like acyl-CoA transferase